MIDKVAIDVFISHHTATCLQITQAICNNLESSGIRCWYAPRDVRGTYAGDIIEAINSCKIFILVLNHQSSISQDVLNELDNAVKRIRNGEDITIIPFQISNEAIGQDAQYYISRWHWIGAVTPPIEERINELKIRVQALMRIEQQGESKEHCGCSKPENEELKSTPILKNHNFVCRSRELNKLHESLLEYNKIFVQGMGGIGKSELVKAYAEKYKDRCQTIIFATYQTSLQDLLIYDRGFQIERFSRACEEDGKLESDGKFFERKLEKIQAICNENTLFIIDNFDTEGDSSLERFLQGSYTIIFTTRNDFSDFGLPVFSVKELDKETEQLELFQHYYKRPVPESKQEIIRQIMCMVNGHTLAIELIAKLMMMKRIQPEKMISMLHEQGICSLDAGNVLHGFSKAQTVYANIRSLFSVYNLSEAEQYVLMNLSLMPLTGVEFDVFMDLCELEDCFDIDTLIKKSWVRYDFAQDKISLHPLIRDIVQNECKVTMQKCSVMIQNLTKELKHLWGMKLTDKLLYTNIGKTVYEKFPKFDIEFAETYLWIGFSVVVQEQFELAMKIFKDCLSGYQNIYGEMSSQVAEAYYRLGDTELYCHNIEASIEYLKKAIGILSDILKVLERKNDTVSIFYKRKVSKLRELQGKTL